MNGASLRIRQDAANLRLRFERASGPASREKPEFTKVNEDFSRHDKDPVGLWASPVRKQRSHGEVIREALKSFARRLTAGCRLARVFLTTGMGKQEKEKEKKVEPPPVQKIPDKNEVPEKPPKEKNPSGNKDNEPEEQISSE